MKTDKPLESVGRDTGMTVPAGYFEQFAQRMAQDLPAQPWEMAGEAKPVQEEQRPLWIRMRPYVYLAAMFAGIWLMMNMFSFFPSLHDNGSVAPAVADAELTEQEYIDEYLVDYESADLYDALYEEGFEPNTLALYDI